MGCVMARVFNEDSVEYDMRPVLHLPVIFVNGVPGAGNQTVAQTIAAMTGYTMIRPGELLREEATKDTSRGRTVADYFSAQDDVPEQIILDLVKEAMLSNETGKGFILVGFPRSARLGRLFRRQIKRPEKIVDLHVDEEVAATRLQSKLSELGRPTSEINAAREIVREASCKVKYARKRFGRHVISLDSTENQRTMASNLRDMLADTIEKFKNLPASPNLTSSAPVVACAADEKEKVEV